MLSKIIKAIEATELEERELRRTAMLSELAREISDREKYFTSAAAAMTILELSVILSKSEVQAILTLLEGYRFRTYLSGRMEM